jgi:hypothetical protein
MAIEGIQNGCKRDDAGAEVELENLARDVDRTRWRGVAKGPRQKLKAAGACDPVVRRRPVHGPARIREATGSRTGQAKVSTSKRNLRQLQEPLVAIFALGKRTA